ncbi:MAG: BNR repeat-containing protein, partial [Candidatus Hydrogenedentes bacterium]|nr:BNR repeat-containing protein [Candidatus Hydrogenedentota bacterium]
MRSRKCATCLTLFFVLLAPVAFTQENQPSALQVLDVALAWSGHSVGYCLLTKNERQYVAYYDHERRMTVAMRDLNSSEWVFKCLPERVNWDSHHYITMCLDQEGHLHVSGNMHGDPLVYYRTEKPYDIKTLRREESMVGENEKKCTYPQFLVDAEGELLFLYRGGKSGDGVQLVNRYDVKTKSWSRLLSTPLFDGFGKVSCYPEGPVQGPDGYFHLVWVWRATGACETNHLLCYARSKDMVHWETATGEPISLPMSPDSKATIIDPVPIEGGMINESTVIGFDKRGRTILSYHKFDANGNTQVYNARFEE